MSECACGCAEGKCECKPGCKCGCNHKKGGAGWAQKSFEKAWGVVKTDVHGIKNRCDLCGDAVPSGTGAHIETVEGGDFDWVCNECAELYASDDDAFQVLAEELTRHRAAEARRKG